MRLVCLQKAFISANKSRAGDAVSQHSCSRFCPQNEPARAAILKVYLVLLKMYLAWISVDDRREACS